MALPPTPNTFGSHPFSPDPLLAQDAIVRRNFDPLPVENLNKFACSLSASPGRPLTDMPCPAGAGATVLAQVEAAPSDVDDYVAQIEAAGQSLTATLNHPESDRSYSQAPNQLIDALTAPGH
jgi:hypothetical protein